MKLRIHHQTTYRFEEPVAYGLQQVRKTPKPTRGQNVVEWHTSISGGQKETSFDDHHNNVVELFSFEKDITDVVVTSSGIVETGDGSGVLGRHVGPSPLWLYQRSTQLTAPGTNVRRLARDAKTTTESGLEQLHALSALIRDVVAYQTGVSHLDWTAERALEEGKGVCQDHTHIFISAAREMGFPSRYVSGYLMLDDRTSQEAMHAWAETFVPDLGWVGFDVSNGISPDHRYVRVATGLDYDDSAPVTGLRVGGQNETLSVALDVAQQ